MFQSLCGGQEATTRQGTGPRQSFALQAEGGANMQSQTQSVTVLHAWLLNRPARCQPSNKPEAPQATTRWHHPGQPNGIRALYPRQQTEAKGKGKHRLCDPVTLDACEHELKRAIPGGLRAPGTLHTPWSTVIEAPAANYSIACSMSIGNHVSRVLLTTKTRRRQTL